MNVCKIPGCGAKVQGSGLCSKHYTRRLHEAAEAAKQLRLSLFTHNDVDRKVS